MESSWKTTLGEGEASGDSPVEPWKRRKSIDYDQGDVRTVAAIELGSGEGAARVWSVWRT